VLRVQVKGPNGNTDPNNRWCYTITDVNGPVFAPFNKFNTKCWDMTGTNFDPASNPISSVTFVVPGANVATPFNYCVAGFAAGNSLADAPAYSPSPYPTIAGTIGGAGSTDLDLQRVKVATAMAGGKQFIIQNNNYGNPTGSDQTITYSANSFTITSSTGNTSGGAPASFPSIYIGGNGNTASVQDPPKGSYSTRGSDTLPRTISNINTISTTVAYNRTSGDYDATYDIWLSSSSPTTTYSDPVSGEVMVWLYKPPSRQPIGSQVATATIGGTTYSVWSGPRGTGTNPNATVVTYVRSTSVTNQALDLKLFLSDAVSRGTFASSWYVTDIFFGFEIWTGSAANGLSVTSFTVDVQ